MPKQEMFLVQFLVIACWQDREAHLSSEAAPHQYNALMDGFRLFNVWAAFNICEQVEMCELTMDSMMCSEES
tara:strand:- start:65 stop:280 length:216 start_codon:yes stop_codon:yes gene_type:complete